MTARWFGATVAFGLMVGAAVAAPPENPDPALGPFYRGLTAPDTGMGCCDTSDCRPVQTRNNQGHEEAFIGRQFPGATNEWVRIPDTKRLSPRENPVGEPVVCWTPGLGVICYVGAAGT